MRHFFTALRRFAIAVLVVLSPVPRRSGAQCRPLPARPDPAPGGIRLHRAIAAIALGAVLWLGTIAPVRAAFCRTVGDREICILAIERSAKNYWEYRAIVSVDGQKRPLEIYDCRRRTRRRADNRLSVPFAPDGPGPLICALLDR